MELSDTGIGKGTHGIVKRIEYEGKTLAVKIYREFPLIPPEAMNEILVYKSLQDRTAVPFRRFAREGKKEHLYMDMCWGNIRQLMDTLSYNDRLVWIKTYWVYLSNDLKKLHSLGWTHGDISPLNILVDEKSRPLFCDFGMSNPPINGARYGGSVGFKAPPSDYHHFYSDWWSLGATFYYFLTGHFFWYESSDIKKLPKPVRRWLNSNPLMRCSKPMLNLQHEILGPLEIPDNIIAVIGLINEGLSIEVSQLAADIIRRYSSYKEVTLTHYPVALEIASKFITRTSLVSDSSGDYEEFRVIELDILEVLNYQLLTMNFIYK